MSKRLGIKEILLYWFAVRNVRTLTVAEIKRVLMYVYNELVLQKLLNKFDIVFDVSVDAIEQMVLFNHTIFAMNEDRDMVYLCSIYKSEEVDKIEIDEDVKKILNEYIKQHSAN